jgi:hypothetical protein
MSILRSAIGIFALILILGLSGIAVAAGGDRSIVVQLKASEASPQDRDAAG